MNAHHGHDCDLEDEFIVEVQRSLFVAVRSTATAGRLGGVLPRRGRVEHAEVEVVERALTQVLQFLRCVVVATG